MKFILKAISQVVPNRAGIEAPSRIEAPVELDEQAMDKMSGTAKRSLVSFEKDGISNAKDTTTYSLPTAVNAESGDVDIWPTRYVIVETKKD